MNTSQLYSFIVVAQNENLSKAASMLYVSQSTLSKNIAKLEEELGVKLFDRRGKKIVLNKQGERFLESSIGILRDIETATQDLRALSNGSGGRLRIGCPGEILPLCDCVSEFCREHPDTYVEIDASIETLDYIEMSNYEMLIYPNGPQFDKLEGYRFCNERYLVVLNSDHPLAARETLGFSDLMDERFVFVRRDQTHPEFAYRLCGAQGLR
ncbi:MAG: LysR family transcriptional regulator, partial [Coriobacteriales bacterium]|nr:LysR family transcriptional regulator [Coriobacteriales bacterium]